jgi:hypothetical protein
MGVAQLNYHEDLDARLGELVVDDVEDEAALLVGDVLNDLGAEKKHAVNS